MKNKKHFLREGFIIADNGKTALDYKLIGKQKLNNVFAN